MVYKRLERILIQLDAVDSTNDYAAALLKSTKVSSGTSIVTKQQQKGRGQRSNMWTSQSGKNLTFSTIFFSALAVRQSFYLNIAVSLAVRKALEDLKIVAKIKWPNDILVGGKKICGILIENQISGDKINSSILGVGLNVNQKTFEDLPNATSIYEEIKEEIELLDIFDQLFGYLDFYLDLLQGSHFELLKKHYYQHLFQINELSNYQDAAGEFLGTILGINEDGLLLVQKEGTETKREYDLKELIYR